MRPASDVHEVFRLADQGLSRAEIARRVGIARATVRDWLDHGKEAVVNRPMRTGAFGHARQMQTCPDECAFLLSLDERAYSYLLGQYLGDGCISRTTTGGSGFRLRVVCCNAYPNIMDECAAAMRVTAPGVQVRYIPRQGCTEVYSTWPHWPCLFPQHGPGMKHTRKIALTMWQRHIALESHPDQFVRGLIHSDGCRHINRVTGANGSRYEYTRYTFSNRSVDIRQLFADACKKLGIEARQMNAFNISVARRASVERLDEIVGPKS
jgi:hypothetical protein